MFYDEGSEWEIIIGSIIVIFAVIFQLWFKYNLKKNPDSYEYDWKSALEEE
jgi:uncharacterized ion transporter superfamily protein YfcC|tara:strand:+ start:335 stop:487 length:153 start_codon:yes stop_codon:yes gene_type:complete